MNTSESSATTNADSPSVNLTHWGIIRFFVPLLLSSALMALEQPIITAGIARLPYPKTSLAVHGAVFSLWVLIEAPVIALLWVSTALARDAHAYRLLLRFSVYLEHRGENTLPVS